MQRDVADIIDRWSIAKLKNERIGTEENKREFEAFILALKEVRGKHPDLEWKNICNLMVSINSTIWFLEASLKGNKDILPNSHNLDDEMNDKILTIIGKNTILIRNVNNLRVQFKNLINKMTNDGFQDVKREHLSE
jgi:hypothetical protein